MQLFRQSISVRPKLWTFAQLMNYETISQYNGDAGGTIFPFGSKTARIQTFNNAVLINSLTYRFVANGGGSPTGSTSLNAYFTQWNPLTNRAVGSAINQQTITVSSGINVAGTGGATFNNVSSTGISTATDALSSSYNYFDLTFSLNATTSPGLTYAMILVGSGTSALSLINLDGLDTFAYGDALTRTLTGTNVSGPGNLANGFNALSTQTASLINGGGTDWGFSAISAIIIPEPSEAAAVLVAGFIGLMVLRRRLQQRAKVQPVAVA